MYKAMSVLHAGFPEYTSRIWTAPIRRGQSTDHRAAPGAGHEQARARAQRRAPQGRLRPSLKPLARGGNARSRLRLAGCSAEHRNRLRNVEETWQAFQAF